MVTKERIKRVAKRIAELEVQISKADFLIANNANRTKANEAKLKNLSTELLSLQAANDTDNKL